MNKKLFVVFGYVYSEPGKLVGIFLSIELAEKAIENEKKESYADKWGIEEVELDRPEVFYI